VIGLAISGAILLLYPLLWKFAHPHPDPWEHAIRDSSGNVVIGAAETVSGNVAGRDNSGHQIHNAPGGTVIVGDVGDGGRIASPQFEYIPGLKLPSAPLPQPEVKIPKLLIRSPQQVCIANESQKLTLSDTGQPGMVVTIENPEAEVGRQGVRAIGVVAIIKFRRNGHLSATSEYACWLDTYENRVTIEPGTSRVLVVGTYSNPKVWLCYTSTLDAPVPRPRSTPAMQAYVNRVHSPLEPQYLLFNPTIDAQITLLSKHDGYTLAQKTYRLSTTETVTGETGAFVYEELP
jgi:hypothetical protein